MKKFICMFLAVLTVCTMFSFMTLQTSAEDVVGWKELSDGSWRYIGEDGVALTGWQNTIPNYEGKWFYFYPDGTMATGWVCGIPGWSGWFYFGEDGIMRTGWIAFNGYYYYCDRNGLMQTGWLYDGGIWYYLNSDGVMLTGWANIDGRQYYFDKSGAMLTNTVVDGRYLGPDGAEYGSPAGSTISDGSLTVICTVAAAVVFGLVGFFIGKKKRPAREE
ncbi:MAG: hypothetical protein MJ101_02825 [Clostridia bacterium]|nr:hypothetical protein [Clostridia bacterium]